ncbi:Methyltransferase domain-containing protein [Eubacterium uniforme]|uniref:site-specific DNA-methyltransferase (adenine-specific) n=1 Tax=Eubacterium uniforme TaxID=39495 RepID=A0A1T4VZ55_9FIRM|nr:BREX-1 system adenine-specific DNA-methyltransferase PglX [Eubacterium uniforme]SKA70304.1 Methyltransferase domain-containing protein [Eubacterium uniforme]
MNKIAIKNFSVWARNKLISDITYRTGLLGITEEGIANPLPQSTNDTAFFDIGTKEPYAINAYQMKQRESLVNEINQKAEEVDYIKAYKYVIENVAYTWFNRLIAIRFMEVNDYLPSHIRVLSSHTGKAEPDMVTNPFDMDVDFSDEEKERIISLKNDNQTDELFQFLFIKECNALNQYLPELFEKTADYTELLLNLSIIDKDGVISRLVNEIPEEDFDIEKGGQVEIIGWLYQYYNTEPKDAAFAKKGKITKEEIPAVTQLFTPDWIVRYMVENSLGRLWLERNAGKADKEVNEVFENTSIKANWKYYLDEAEQEEDVKKQLKSIRKEYASLNPEDIHFIDPCMGSGHILVYAFDLLMQIYTSVGWTERDAAKSIVENNLYGLDIDDRAYQLAYFAVMMKARQYNRRILSSEVKCYLYSIKESNRINRNQIKYLGAGLSDIERNLAQGQLEGLLDTFIDAKEYGSILNVEKCDWNLLRFFVMDDNTSGQQMSLEAVGIDETKEKILELIDIGEVMANKYEVVVTNPPYMGGNGMSARLVYFLKNKYPNSKYDLYSVFIEKCGKMAKQYYAMITQHSWMFLATFEILRSIILRDTIANMAHLGARAFDEIGGEVVQTTTFVVNKHLIDGYSGNYVRLLNVNGEREKEKKFLSGVDRYSANQFSYDNIPGKTFAYWVSKDMFKIFANNNKLTSYAYTKGGMGTSDNDRFLRLWYEVELNNIAFGVKNHSDADNRREKWFPYNKGGSYRKWYGNNDYLVNWQNNGKEIKEYAAKLYKSYSRTVKNIDSFFLEGATWSSLANKFSLRYSESGFIFDSKGSMLFTYKKEDLFPIIGFLNSKVSDNFLAILSPTLDFSGGSLSKLTVLPEIFKKEVSELVAENIKLAKEDWDDFEKSWNFKYHPFFKFTKAIMNYSDLLESIREECGENIEDFCPIKVNYLMWKKYCNKRFVKMKANEERLNSIFIGLYKLEYEIDFTLEDDDISVYKADMERDIKSFISYAVGCMFGRYSLDVEGLVYVGGEWDSSKYTTYIPDYDSIIPITDEEYFKDDIVGLLCDWLKKVYGEDTLEQNLDFIASALSNKGNTSREIIRNYFVNDFYKDHCMTYSVAGSGKRPIYWLFDSGKQNGFKALIYLHRYNADTIGNLRVDYLHRMQKVYESEIDRMHDVVNHSTNNREVGVARKRIEKLQKQLKECKDYDEKIGHLALSRIELDLDDGVKVNYRKIQTANDGKFYEVLSDSKKIMSKE